MIKTISMGFALLGCMFQLYSSGDHAETQRGRVVSLSEDRAVVEITNAPLALRISFSFEENKLDATEVTVGDTVSFAYMGWLVPDFLGDTDVRGWGLARKEMDGILLSLDENQVVVQPMPDDPLAGQVEELMFLRDNRDLKRDIGVHIGDSVSVIYVRDVIPGNPPQIEAINWGVYVDMDAWEEEIIKNMEKP